MFRYLLFLIGLIFLVWTAATSLTQVQSHERAVIRRFGRILDDKPQQGLYIGLPWGIDRVDLAPVGRVRTVDVGVQDKEEKNEDTTPRGQMVTGDHNLVDVQAKINFRVREADLDKYVLNQDQVDAFVARAAESLLAEWIAARRVDDILRHGKTLLPTFLHARLQERIRDYDLGIEIETASITRLDPPDEVKGAFDGLAKSQTSIGTKINRAKQDAATRRSEAKAEEYKILSLAKSYARVEEINAAADADSFLQRLEQYREGMRTNPDYINALWLDNVTRLFMRMRENGRIDLLDHYLNNGGLSITQFPLQPRKKKAPE